jgi:hypothetical protein
MEMKLSEAALPRRLRPMWGMVGESKMKRVYLAGVGTFIALVLLLVIVGHNASPPVPRFVPGAPRSLPGFKFQEYEWVTDLPFQGGRMWVWLGGARTNFHCYLYDLEKRQILGEVFNGGCPVLGCRSNSLVLCQGPDSFSVSTKQHLIDLAQHIFGKKAVASSKRTETFWILDIASNTATRLGLHEQFPGAGSRWHGSPEGRYGYTVPSTAMDEWFDLCDFEARKMSRVPITGSLQGWWSEREILVHDGSNNFVAFDVTTRKNRPVFSPEMIRGFLIQNGLTNDADVLRAMPVWNGKGYDFYFGPSARIDGLRGPDSFLLKAERSGPGLKLVCRNFRYQWGGSLDSTGARYLFQGESGVPGRSGNGAVYLRNVDDGKVATVVPPDNGGQYAIPRFYGDEVVYFSKRALYRTALDGQGNSRLLTVSTNGGMANGTSQ